MIDMKIKVVCYNPSYFGIMLRDEQLIHLRRIAADRAEPVEVIIRRAIHRGFIGLQFYSFSEGN